MKSARCHPGSHTILLLTVTALLSVPAQARYSGGSGTADDPYQIATAADLIAFGEALKDYEKHFILTADIDMDPALPGRKIFQEAVIAPDSDSVESGFQGHMFTAVLDGDGHVIRNLHIQGAGYLGLFGQLGAGGRIANVDLQAVQIDGTGHHVGGLVGKNSSGTVTASRSSGTVLGVGGVGGLVGTNYGSIVASCSAGMVAGEEGVGGLVGENWYGTIVDSYSTAAVTGEEAVGGLAGANWGGSITAGYSCGAVRGGARHIGGLVGRCVFGDITASFWDMDSSGQSAGAGGTGLTTDLMQDAGAYLCAGWDFVDEKYNGTEETWWIHEGLDYPRLWWERFAWFPDYMPLDPNEHGLKTFEWVYGRAGTYTSEIGGCETVPYTSGPITGVEIENCWGLHTALFSNDGTSVKLLGLGNWFLWPDSDVSEWFVSTYPDMSAHPSCWSFGQLRDGMLIDQGTWYLVAKDAPDWEREADQLLLIGIQDVTVPAGTYADSVVMWWLDASYPFAPLAFGREESNLGLTLPSRVDTDGYAVTDFEVYAPGVGLIAHGDVDAATGDLVDLAVLLEQRPLGDDAEPVDDSGLSGSWRATSTGWVGGWPIRLEGTGVSAVFVFEDDTFTVTVKESSVLLCETTGTFRTSEGILYLTPSAMQGSECTSGFLVPAAAEYFISGDLLTLTEIADDPVWYELERIE